MRHALICVSVCTLLLAAGVILVQAGCGRRPTTGQVGQAVEVPAASPALAQLLEGLSYGEPVTGGNLTVVPLVRAITAATPPAEYLTLDEALESKVLVIKELDESGNVPELEAISTADKDIFIPFGTIVTGGKQNRMIRRDVVIAKKAKAKLPVYCVEQGRWTAGNIALARAVDGGAAFGHVDARSYNSSLELKQYANVMMPQGQIWAKVGAQNAKLKNDSGSSDFRGNFDTAGYRKKRAELEPVQAKVPGENVVGYVGLVDGKVIGCEIFASPDYFAKVWPPLFEGMVISAAASEKPEAVDAATAGGLAADYLAVAATSQVQQTEEKDQTLYRMELHDRAGSASVDPESGKMIYFRNFAKPEASPPETDAPQRLEELQNRQEVLQPQPQPAE